MLFNFNQSELITGKWSTHHVLPIQYYLPTGITFDRKLKKNTKGNDRVDMNKLVHILSSEQDVNTTKQSRFDKYIVMWQTWEKK